MGVVGGAQDFASRTSPLAAHLENTLPSLLSWQLGYAGADRVKQLRDAEAYLKGRLGDPERPGDNAKFDKADFGKLYTEVPPSRLPSYVHWQQLPSSPAVSCPSLALSPRSDPFALTCVWYRAGWLCRGTADVTLLSMSTYLSKFVGGHSQSPDSIEIPGQYKGGRSRPYRCVLLAVAPRPQRAPPSRWLAAVANSHRRPP
jgi:hypothetical protein